MISDLDLTMEFRPGDLVTFGPSTYYVYTLITDISETRVYFRDYTVFPGEHHEWSSPRAKFMANRGLEFYTTSLRDDET